MKMFYDSVGNPFPAGREKETFVVEGKNAPSASPVLSQNEETLVLLCAIATETLLISFVAAENAPPESEGDWMHLPAGVLLYMVVPKNHLIYVFSGNLKVTVIE